MSLHKSLKVSSWLRRKRNVLKREERLDRLAELGKWEEGDSVFHLPKTRIALVKKLGKKKKKKKEEEEAAAAAAAVATTT